MPSELTLEERADRIMLAAGAPRDSNRAVRNAALGHLRAVQSEERESCALIAEGWAAKANLLANHRDYEILRDLAAAIREGK